MTREKFLELESQLNDEHKKMVEERAELLGLGTVEGLQKAQELNAKINLNISNHEKLIMEYCKASSASKTIEENLTEEWETLEIKGEDEGMINDHIAMIKRLYKWSSYLPAQPIVRGFAPNKIEGYRAEITILK